MTIYFKNIAFHPLGHSRSVESVDEFLAKPVRREDLDKFLLRPGEVWAIDDVLIFVEVGAFDVDQEKRDED